MFHGYIQIEKILIVHFDFSRCSDIHQEKIKFLFFYRNICNILKVNCLWNNFSLYLSLKISALNYPRFVFSQILCETGSPIPYPQARLRFFSTNSLETFYTISLFHWVLNDRIIFQIQKQILKVLPTNSKFAG